MWRFIHVPFFSSLFICMTELYSIVQIHQNLFTPSHVNGIWVVSGFFPIVFKAAVYIYVQVFLCPRMTFILSFLQSSKFWSKLKKKYKNVVLSDSSGTFIDVNSWVLKKYCKTHHNLNVIILAILSAKFSGIKSIALLPSPPSSPWIPFNLQNSSSVLSKQ